MRYYLQVYEDRSFTSAARKLFISQQGLIKIIRTIEKEYQVKLFERFTHGLQPTEKGNIMYTYCRQMVASYDKMTGSLIHQESSQIIRVGTTSVIYSERLVDGIVEFHDQHPDMKFEFSLLGYYECERCLENNMIDLCFTVKPDNIVNYKFIPIWKDRFLLYINKKNRLYQKKNISLSDLKDEKIVLLSGDTKGGTIIRDYLKEHNFNPDVIMSTSQMGLAFAYVIGNRAIGILPEYAVPAAFRNREEVAVMQADDLSCFFQMGLFFKNRNLSMDEKILVEHIYTRLHNLSYRVD